MEFNFIIEVLLPSPSFISMSHTAPNFNNVAKDYQKLEGSIFDSISKYEAKNLATQVARDIMETSYYSEP